MWKWMMAALMGCALAAVPTAGAAEEADNLEKGFIAPPDSAKPWVYWWWLDSNASREGITRDLEEMKRQGIGGALVFDAGVGHTAPVGPVFMSPPWRELFKHAVREADRIGIEISINLCSGWNAGGTWVKPEHAAQKVAWAQVQVRGPADVAQVLPQPATVGNYYRDIAVLAFRASGGADPTPQLTAPKKGEKPGGLRGACESRAILDLSAKLDGTGRLVWQAPEGNWRVLRFGHTLVGATTKCVSPGAQGPEIDPLSAEAMDMHFAATAEKLVADVGPLAGKTLTYTHIDSWELQGNPNWSPRLRDAFKRQCGYDPLPYLPALAGITVDSPEIGERFLWDLRRVVADCIADNYYGRLRDLSRRHGMGIHPESGGPFFGHWIDALQCEGRNDIPMGEFWIRLREPDGPTQDARWFGSSDTVKQAASAAHIYGKRICQAEAFTNMGRNWEEDPFMLKDVGDRALCNGLTRLMLCFYVHQPYLDLKPGYQWPEAGTHFDRNITWWNQMHAYTAYLSRSQFLLQQGLFVADVCYFYGQDAPNFVPSKRHMTPPLPPGRDCDTINAEVLLSRMSVRDGRLTLPDGMSYRMLVLPERRTMSPQVLRKIKELVEAGATVAGPKPERAPGLSAYPQCDTEVKRLAEEVWGEVDGQKVRERKVGRGRIIWGKALPEILADAGVPPDFEFRGAAEGANLDFIHRTSGGAEIYFVSNQQNRPEKAECLFRVAGRQPEIWDAVTGEHGDATDFRPDGGRTVVPLEFAPRQSWFIVFRRPAGEAKPRQPNIPALTAAGELLGPWTVRFDPKWGGPESVVFEKLQDWTKRPEEGIRHYSGKATYEKSFDLPEALRSPGRRLYLDLGKVKNVAEVRLNGKPLGVVWTAPWHVQITQAAKPAGNRLEIDVVNLWPNRLIGDSKLSPDKRLTKTNVTKFYTPPKNGGEHPLLESGLLGPVTLRAAETVVVQP